MKLRALNIEVMNLVEFMSKTKEAIFGDLTKIKTQYNLSVDSLETFKKGMTTNKLQILMAISRLKPVSINQLAKFLNRDYPHVFNDCKALEVERFIILEEQVGLRKQLKPKLIFNYDIIRVKSPIEEIYSISERSNKVLLSDVRI
jgi:predicted transcriptional regulator